MDHGVGHVMELMVELLQPVVLITKTSLHLQIILLQIVDKQEQQDRLLGRVGRYIVLHGMKILVF